MGRDRSKFERAFLRIFHALPPAQDLDYVFDAYAEGAVMADSVSGPPRAPQQLLNCKRETSQAVEQDSGHAILDAAAWPLRATEPWRLSTTSRHEEPFPHISSSQSEALSDAVGRSMQWKPSWVAQVDIQQVNQAQ